VSKYVPKSRSVPKSNSLPAVQPLERCAYRVNEFCAVYRVSRATAYNLMAAGKLRYFMIGKDRRISVEAAEALAAGE
jgi:excisionase family DNA binding protein